MAVVFKVSGAQGGSMSASNNRRLTREEQAILFGQKQVRKLKFNLFLKCVLDFQLRNH